MFRDKDLKSFRIVAIQIISLVCYWTCLVQEKKERKRKEMHILSNGVHTSTIYIIESSDIIE